MNEERRGWSLEMMDTCTGAVTGKPAQQIRVEAPENLQLSAC